MLATGILTQNKRYAVSMLTLWLRLIVLVARLQKYSAQHGRPRHLNTCVMSDFYTWSFRFVNKLKPMYSSKMVIEHSFQHISLISSYINTNKTLILSLFCKRRLSYFPVKNTHGGKDWDLHCDCFSNLSVLDTTTSTRETPLINNIEVKVSELVIITEVKTKFIKKLLHVECENCNGQKWLKLTKGLYSQS